MNIDNDEHSDSIGWQIVQKHAPFFKPAELAKAIDDACQAECNRAKKEMADNLIDQEVRLENTFSDDSKICVGIKLMADEVREYYDGGIYSLHRLPEKGMSDE